MNRNCNVQTLHPHLGIQSLHEHRVQPEQ